MTTKKTFQAFADKISEFENDEDATKMALLCCEVFFLDNPRFDAERFIIACGLDPRDSVFSHPRVERKEP